jgi:hypothetical protein
MRWGQPIWWGEAPERQKVFAGVTVHQVARCFGPPDVPSRGLQCATRILDVAAQ